MKKKLNIYGFILIAIAIAIIWENMYDAILSCFDLGRGVAPIDLSQPGWIAKLLCWSLDLNAMLIAGVFIIAAVGNINKSEVFSWKNVRLFRWSGTMLFAHFILRTVINGIDMYVFGTYDGVVWILDLHAFIASVFVLMVGEIFAIGLKLQEEQDLTI